MKILFVASIVAMELVAAVTVATSQYDIARTGANTTETVLNRTNLDTVVIRGSYTLDGKMWAQPLIIPGVGGRRVVLASTDNASVYAFDADHPGTAPLWTPFSAGAALTQSNYPNINDLYHGKVGCMSTGAINTANNTFLFTCVTQEHGWQLYARNIADGSEFHAPYTFAGTDKGLTFDSTKHLQRSALLLVGGSVVSCFTGYGDNSVGTSPYQGWCFFNDALTLARVGIWSPVNSPGGMAGIWSSGGGPASDGLDIFHITGNGDFDGVNNFGNSFVYLSGLDPIGELLDWGTPSNWATLNSTDADIAAGKVIYVAPHWLLGAGKDGRLFVIRTTGFGNLQGVGNGPKQVFNAQNGGVFGCTVYANGSIILSGNNTTMKRYDFNTVTGLFNTSATGIGSDTYTNPGPACSYTSNGSDASTGILWGVTGTSFGTLGTGTLRAWNASTLGEIQRWSASWQMSKFASATIADGDIFIPAVNEMVVYGIPPGSAVSITGKATISGKASIQ